MAYDSDPLASGAAGLSPATRVRSRGSRDYLSASPLVRSSIARDIEEDTASEDEGDNNAISDGSDSDVDSETGAALPHYGAAPVELAASYRRGSFAGAGSRATVVPGAHSSERAPTRAERHAAWREERSLLRDNNVIPPKHPQVTHRTSRISLIPGGDRRVVRPEESAAQQAAPDGIAASSEETPLLGDPAQPYGGQADDPEAINKKWEEAVAAGRIRTTWQREAKVLGRYTAPLVVTFMLQYSLTVASVFAVGHIGTVELGAVSLASMSANITGYAIYQGLATSLDTLCAQAYGSGKKKLVGLQLQRAVYFLWLCTIPIGVLWLAAPAILRAIVPEQETAELAGLYLRVVLIGAPGYAAFECGKRYVQAQGLFSASLWVLIVCAPLNAFLNWLFVWKFQWGFVGAPIAVAFVEDLMPLMLAAYVYFVAGRQCWPGFTRRALHNWTPMIRLALPGLVMVEAECLAFEVLTLASSYFGTTPLAAQSVLATACSIAWQIPFPLSIATSTRVANLIGATLADAAKTTARVGMAMAVGVGLLNVTLLLALRDYIPRLFSDDPAVWVMVAEVLPICAAFQLFDALAANCNGTLRGLGRQEIGGYVQLFSYYVVAMPISMGTAFFAGWGLVGLWTGVAIALGLVFFIEVVFIFRTNWERSVEDAQRRNDLS